MSLFRRQRPCAAWSIPDRLRSHGRSCRPSRTTTATRPWDRRPASGPRSRVTSATWLSAGGDVKVTGAVGDSPAATDYELGAGLGFALTDTST